MQTCDMKKHMKANHNKFSKKECTVCGKMFMKNHVLEAHLKTHNEIQPFFCDMCDKKFYSKWRLEKHISGHNINKFCHYYNNQKFCPYEEIGLSSATKFQLSVCPQSAQIFSVSIVIVIIK